MNKRNPTMEDLRTAGAALMLEWARLLVPHFGASGSLDLDLRDWPGAAGPSFYNQFTAASLLLLADGTMPGATAGERRRFGEIARRNLDYTIGLVDADFRTPHFSRGRDWGRHIGEWLVYYQLMAVEHLTADADAELRNRLERVVAGATEAAYRDFQSRYVGVAAEFAGNHATWHALLFVQAGRHFGREDWRQYGCDFMRRRVLPFQDSAGGWPEGGGTVVGYSMVTAQAVSLYADMTGDRQAEAAVARALTFHEFFLLPDASNAVVVDLRMRRHPRPSICLPPGFAEHPHGRRLAANAIARFREALRREGVHDNGGQGLAFFGSFWAALRHRPREPEQGALPPPGNFHQVGRVADSGWVAYVGWQVAPEWTHNRFVLDSQNFLEVWHEKAGYLIGTGNSKFMPRFSTWRRLDKGRAYVPDRAEGHQRDATTLVARYFFGEDCLKLTLQPGIAGCDIAVECQSAPSGATYEFGVMLDLRPGEEFRDATGTKRVQPGEQLELSGDFHWRGLRWKAPHGSRLAYPVVPHNCYTQDGWSPPDAHVARLSFVVGAAPATLRIQPESISAATP